MAGTTSAVVVVAVAVGGVAADGAEVVVTCRTRPVPFDRQGASELVGVRLASRSNGALARAGPPPIMFRRWVRRDTTLRKLGVAGKRGTAGKPVTVGKLGPVGKPGTVGQLGSVDKLGTAGTLGTLGTQGTLGTLDAPDTAFA